eukprot:TRINITY_DN187_c0_g2_i1.p1 TRINITY_DN187_c0_g2~~TRINITY_DN187_c0_g2_i1.p1  ORF type:complete len:439 (-),score=126.61 TRINITY_DN187_c0_g2_i1:102-1235(-)
MEVRRRYSDFVWLRSQLVVNHPEIIVPPIPQKKTDKFMDRFGIEFLEKRRKGLELFLNRVALHPVLIASMDLNTFLCAKEWELKTVQSESSENPNTIASLSQKLSAMKVIKNITEDPELTRFESIRKYFQNLQTHLIQTCEKVELIHKKNQEFIAEYTSLGPAFLWLGESETELGQPLNSVGRAYTDQFVPYLIELNQQQEFGLLQSLHQYVFIVEAGLEVLIRRDIIHAEYITAQKTLENTRTELARAQQEQLNSSSSSSSSGFSFLKMNFEDPQTKIQRLELRLEQEETALQNKKKELEKATTTILSEIDRFHKWKTHDFKLLLQDLVQSQMEFHRKVQGAWQELAPQIEELTLENVRRTFWMAQPRQSLSSSTE